MPFLRGLSFVSRPNSYIRPHEDVIDSTSFDPSCGIFVVFMVRR